MTLVALLGFQVGGAVASAKDYVVDETDIKITYAVNTTDLIARVKKVETVYLSKRQSVEIPKTLKYKSGSKTYNLTVTKIGDNAFEHIDYKTIKLPNTITHIGKRAFAYTSSPEINVPSQLQSIGEEAFAYSDHNICIDVFLLLTLHQIIKMLSWLRKELLVMLAFPQKRKT